MSFKYNEVTRLYENDFVKDGFKFNFVNKESLKITCLATIGNGSNAELYYDENSVLKKEKRGIAHYLEHLMFTKESTNTDYLKTFIEKKVSFNASTGETATFYYLTSEIDKFINNYLYDLQTIFMTLDITDKSINKEKGIVTTEVTMSKDSQETKINDIVKKYTNENYGSVGIAGIVEEVEQIHLEDVINFYKDLYSKDNSEITFIGDFINQPDLVDIIVNKFLENWYDIKNKYNVTFSETSRVRKPALINHVEFDRSSNDVFSTLVSTEMFVRSYALDASKLNINKSWLYINSLFSGLTSLLNPHINKKIENELIEKNLSQSVNVVTDSVSQSKNMLTINVITFDKDKKENIFKYFESVLLNIDDYINAEIFDIEQFKISKDLGDLNSADATIDMLLNMRIMPSMLSKNYLNISEWRKEYISTDDLFNYKLYNSMLNESNFINNYIDFNIMKSNTVQ